MSLEVELGGVYSEHYQSNEEFRQTMNERAEMEGTGYDKQIRIRTRAENDAAVIEVEDNGVGMDEAPWQHLFEPFFPQRTPTAVRVWGYRSFMPLFATTTGRLLWRASSPRFLPKRTMVLDFITSRR